MLRTAYPSPNLYLLLIQYNFLRFPSTYMSGSFTIDCLVNRFSKIMRIFYGRTNYIYKIRANSKALLLGWYAACRSCHVKRVKTHVERYCQFVNQTKLLNTSSQLSHLFFFCIEANVLVKLWGVHCIFKHIYYSILLRKSLITGFS